MFRVSKIRLAVFTFVSFHRTLFGESENCGMTETTKCPTSKDEFTNRSEEFGCTNAVYTCVLDDHNRLVEICAFNYDIPSNMNGCPVMTCGSDGPGLSPSSFAFCPKNIQGCPDSSYGKYNTSTVYLYPKCLLRLQDRFSRFHGEKESCRNFSDKPNTSMHKCDSTTYLDLKLVTISSLPLNMICILLLLIMICRNRLVDKNMNGRGSYSLLTLWLYIYIPCSICDTERNCGMKETRECAKTPEEFQRRAEKFNCTNSFYTCMLTVDDLLVETCASIYDITPSSKDCPVIICGSRGVGLSKSSVAYCPDNIAGCPNGIHSTFNTSCLYLYPKCLLRLQDRFADRESSLSEYKENVSLKTTLDEMKETLTDYRFCSSIAIVSLVLNAMTICILCILLKILIYHLKGNRYAGKNIRRQQPMNFPCFI